MQVVHSGETNDPMLVACIRNIWLEASIYDINIKSEHITGKNNVVADALGVNVGKNLGRKSRFKKVSFQVLPEGCDRWTGSYMDRK